MHEGHSLNCGFSVNATMIVFSTEYLHFLGNSSPEFFRFVTEIIQIKLTWEKKVPRNKTHTEWT